MTSKQNEFRDYEDFPDERRSHEYDRERAALQRDAAQETEVRDGDDVRGDGAGGGECVRVVELMKQPFSIASLPSDIASRIQNDFPEDHAEVIKEIETVMQRNDELANERTVRCVIHLASGSRQRLRSELASSIQDYRDPLFAAEYDGRKSGETPVRVRDFSKPFGQNEIQ